MRSASLVSLGKKQVSAGFSVACDRPRQQIQDRVKGSGLGGERLALMIWAFCRTCWVYSIPLGGLMAHSWSQAVSSSS